MLYHISLDLIDEFKLRVPDSSYDDEDKTIKRICFAKSVEGAITAMPYNIKVLSGILNMEKELGLKPLLYVYSIDEREIDLDKIKDSNELVEEKLVLDANITEEVWVLTENIKPKLSVIKVIDFNFDIQKFDNKLIYIITKLKFEEATQEEISATKNHWDELSNLLKEQYNKTITPVLKRAYIAHLSSI